MAKGYKIALFLEASRHYGRELTTGIARYSRSFGPWSFYRDDQFYMNRRKNDLSYLKKWGVDGVIARDSKAATALFELDVPIISARNLGFLEGQAQILTDDKAIGQLAFDHFHKKGFKNFAYCGFSDMPWSQHREKSFVDALSQSDVKIHVFHSNSSARMLKRSDEYSKMANWLKSLPKPIAIFCCNDDRGYDVIEACKIAEVEVPYEAAVLGNDNDLQICDISSPALSSIRMGIEKAGYEAAACLHKLIEGQPIESNKIITAPIDVVIRQSTDIMANKDKTVTTALQFIQENSYKLIQTADVAKAVKSSRRNLDEKFRKALNHTVFAEIRRVRTETICRLLIETNMTVFEIALMLGYNDADHIARFFKSEKKITPQLFRKTYGIKEPYYQSK